MIPRMTLDISWSDLCAGLIGCVAPSTPKYERVEEGWAPGQGFAHLSVRSTFDAYLGTRGWPAGSEVMMSAISIPHMAELVRAWGYVPIPIDLDPSDMSPDLEQVKERATEQTRAVLVAHLFGGLLALDALAELCKTRGWSLIEDCAQAYEGTYKGHAGATLSLFSFGSIKSSTALGGALTTIRDAELRSEMSAYRDAQPVQSQRSFGLKVMKSALLKLITRPRVFGALWWCTSALKVDFDQLLNASVRGFSGPHFYERIRHQPCQALLKLLHRRVTQERTRYFEQRGEMVEALCATLPPQIQALGRASRNNTGWIIPVQVPEPEALTAYLRAKGYDATHKSSSMEVIRSASGQREAERALVFFQDVLYLPIYPPLGVSGYRALNAVIKDFYETTEEERGHV